MNFSTKHTLDTQAPQTYVEHFKVAFVNSSKLIWYGIAGIIHAFLPEIKTFQFYTSTGVIRSYKMLEESKRHDDEIETIFSQERRKYVEEHRGK